MNTSRIRQLLQTHRDEVAFLVGNGINLYYNDSPSTWDNLLLDLWGNYSFSTRSEIPRGISFTEFYDALEIQNYHQKGFGSKMQKDVQRSMASWRVNRKQNILLDTIAKFNAPLLTTNFDDQIPRSMSLKIFRIIGSKFTDYYPWSTYYGHENLSCPSEGFGVWYINGMIKYHRSIKLGLSQYMGNVSRARGILGAQSRPPNSVFVSC